MASSIGDQGVGGEPTYAGDESAAEGPDPVIGAGITLLGIFLMGTGGARDAHYVFDFGVLTAGLGAITFVLFVALSAMKQRRARQVEVEVEVEVEAPAPPADLHEPPAA